MTLLYISLVGVFYGGPFPLTISYLAFPSQPLHSEQVQSRHFPMDTGKVYGIWWTFSSTCAVLGPTKATPAAVKEPRVWMQRGGAEQRVDCPTGILKLWRSISKKPSELFLHSWWITQAKPFGLLYPSPNQTIVWSHSWYFLPNMFFHSLQHN